MVLCWTTASVPEDECKARCMKSYMGMPKLAVALRARDGSLRRTRKDLTMPKFAG